MTTFYRVKKGERVLGDGGTSKEIQAILATAEPREYLADVVTRDDPQDAGAARHWGRAIRHPDGLVHLESDQPGE